jgi:SAM-dependent methyltransferase
MVAELDDLRAWLRSLLRVPERGTVIDLGCGAGEDLQALACMKPGATFVGLDRSAELIKRARAANTMANAVFEVEDLSHGLPFNDASIGALYSVNLLECVADKARFVSECARVLEPGGSIVVAHFDWDTQTFDGGDRDSVRRIVHAFNDWQQAWMDTIDPWAGRRLGRFFGGGGLFTGEVQARTLIDTSFAPGSYARNQAESFEALVRRDLISADEYENFMKFQHEAAQRGTFMYSVTMFAFAGTRV